MLEDVSVCWFKVLKCGYYKSTQAQDPEFYGLSPLLNDLQAWSIGKDLSETVTHGLTEQERADGLLPVYLQKVHGGGDNWIFALWNEIPSTEGAVASLPAKGKVGDTRVKMNGIEPGTIPGFATYFYVVPSHNAIAGIRFSSRSYGHDSMRRYMRGFVTRHSRHAVISNESTASEVELLGYAFNAAKDEPRNLAAMFKSATVRQKGQTDMLMAKCADIRRMVRKTTLTARRAPDRDSWQKLMDLVRADMPMPHALHETRVTYEVGMRFTPEQLAALFNEMESEEETYDSWDDLGFNLTGDMQKTHWVTRSMASVKIKIEVPRVNSELVDAELALRHLVRNRDVLLAAMRNGSDL